MLNTVALTFTHCMFNAAVCPPITPLLNGHMVGGKHIGEQFWFACKSGFTLIGPSTIKCQVNRTWSDKPPICGMVIHYTTQCDVTLFCAHNTHTIQTLCSHNIPAHTWPHTIHSLCTQHTIHSLCTQHTYIICLLQFCPSVMSHLQFCSKF